MSAKQAQNDPRKTKIFYNSEMPDLPFPETENYKFGGVYAYAGLDPEGFVQKVIQGNKIAGNPTEGINVTNEYLGYYTGTDWKVYIKSDGQFMFKGNDNHYITWDGAVLNIRGQLNADDILAGTITGITLQTAASGARLVFNSTDYLRGFDANKLRVQLVTDELRFYTQQVGDNNYISIKAVNETIGGVTFHTLKFLETWGTGWRDAMFEFHVFPAADSTYLLGLKDVDGVLAWAQVVGDYGIFDVIDSVLDGGITVIDDLILSYDLAVKGGQINLYAAYPNKYIKIDTNKGDVADTNNGPDLFSDYHCIRFLTDGGGDNSAGHIIASGNKAGDHAPTIGSEYGYGTSNRAWVLLVHYGNKGVIETGHIGSGGNTGGPLVLAPETLVKVENSKVFRFEQASDAYCDINFSASHLNIQLGGGGLGSPYGIKVWNWIVPNANISLALGNESLNWNYLYARYISYGANSQFTFQGAGDIICHQDFVSNTTNEDLGASDRKWNALYVKDIVLDNDWRIIENDKLGIKQQGVGIVNSRGTLKFFIGNKDIYVSGGRMKNLKDLK